MRRFLLFSRRLVHFFLFLSYYLLAFSRSLSFLIAFAFLSWTVSHSRTIPARIFTDFRLYGYNVGGLITCGSRNCRLCAASIGRKNNRMEGWGNRSFLIMADSLGPQTVSTCVGSGLKNPFGGR